MPKSLTEAIENVVWNILSDLHTCIPAVIEKYDHKTHKADVKPMITKTYTDGTEMKLPVISSVPVVFPRSKEASFTFPIKKGDGVLLVFSERPLDTWLSTGKESPPNDGRKFDLTDAIAIVGLFSFEEPALEDNNEDALIKYKDSEIRIKKSGDIIINCKKATVNASGDIKLGDGTVKKLVNEEFVNLYNNHVHNYIDTNAAAVIIGSTSTPASLTGLGVVPVATLPAVPPSGLLGDSIGNSHMTSKTEAE
ncbi:MAG: hypothetical protein KAU20_02225 [Nanoarchaeota archaeon]|nr:hypothetical protein [Nanoarchaeota archaeon]